jgi:hypothetical protein
VSRQAQRAAFCGLVCAALALVAGAALATVARLPTPLAGLAALCAVGVVAVAVEEWRGPLASPGAFSFDRTDGYAALALVVAGPVTYLCHAQTGLGPVVASALVGLVAGLVVPDYGVPAYCGSFVGMASPALVGGVAAVAAASLVAAGVYVLGKRLFVGFGGKLGTTAFVGVGVAVLAGGGPLPPGSLPADPVCGACLATGLVAAVAAYAVSVHLDRGPVVGSALVGLVAGLLAPAVVPGGETLAAAAFCASFVGMSRPDRLGGTPAVGAAGLVSGALFVGAAPRFVGFGGKLGTVAFVSCLVVAAGREWLPAVAVPTDLTT